ncbi:hydroxymethylglutaryl-CoA lyase [Robertmurraya korlensis]|uniref:hydroxymethylglutaryl-CoA lyase n=1 Tax=Robertmurraya korlensis TaxID=519977 RepID=UPI000826D3EE|nr:hydroxymethylglutaryl-CoA lyase [Robertmurraya korlensis]
MTIDLPKTVTIIEVGPRDGLQNVSVFIPTDAKNQFITDLKIAGVKEMEVSSFVSPKWIPQMRDAEEVALHSLDNQVRTIVLAPNRAGIERALGSNCKDIAIFIGVSNSFNQKNINRTTTQAREELLPIVKELKELGCFVRTCISTAFYCPFEGHINEEDTIQLCQQFVQAGADELSVADTIGMAAPHESYSLFSKLTSLFSETLITAHFHDTRGMALANIFAALQAGVSRFDTSAGGIGGCPFAPGASGNVATEDVVYMLERMGIQTGIQLPLLFQAIEGIVPHLPKPITSSYYTLLQKA